AVGNSCSPSQICQYPASRVNRNCGPSLVPRHSNVWELSKASNSFRATKLELLTCSGTRTAGLAFGSELYFLLFLDTFSGRNNSGRRSEYITGRIGKFQWQIW
ncbi:hypothetical protein RB213_004453, partial [Colletotrichum asianum]